LSVHASLSPRVEQSWGLQVRPPLLRAARPGALARWRFEVVAPTHGSQHSSARMPGCSHLDLWVQEWFQVTGIHVCTQKSRCRRPGIGPKPVLGQRRGQRPRSPPARLQGAGLSEQGWDSPAIARTASTSRRQAACRTATRPRLGLRRSGRHGLPGWSSKRDPERAAPVHQPRVDRDTSAGRPLHGRPGGRHVLWPPENINPDNPHDGDSFRGRRDHYGSDVFAGANSPNSRATVNLYCNGERVTSIGLQPNHRLRVSRAEYSRGRSVWRLLDRRYHQGHGERLRAVDGL